MAAFVVISTDNRLSSLVDGIEKSLPLNPNVGADISTGKIEKKGDEYFYQYHINSEGKDDNEKGDLFKLVLNQLSAFRREYGVSGTLNVFMLENPRTEKELQLLEDWFKELERLFTATGSSGDKDIHIYRVLFTYDVEKPDDVTNQLSPDIFKSYLERKDKYAFKDSSSVLIISNRDDSGATISFSKEEHDLKLPRLLADFMMLLSSTNSSYNVSNAINHSEESCFSLGYAESMYFFPDVREYYQHADICSLYGRILKDSDETLQHDNDEEAMNIEFYPLGLDKRRKRLSYKYSDVPFNQDIKSHKGSADFIVDDCLLKLKDLYCNKREEEIERKRQEIDNKIAELEEEYNSMSREDWESDEEFKARKKGKFEEKERKVKELRDELSRFIEGFPGFISREDIYDHFDGYDDKKEKEEYLNKKEGQYGKLVVYIKSNDFFDYVKEYDDKNSVNQPVIVSNNLQNNPGCWLKFWGRKKQETPTPIPKPKPKPTPSLMLDNVKEIRKQLSLKEKFEDFLSKRDKIEQTMKDEEEWCNKFKLTNHSHHYYHLIDLKELKDYQIKKFDERFMQILTRWDDDEDNRTLTQLEKLLHQDTETYTEELKYIDWNKPFPFVSDTSDTKLSDVCDNLYMKSSPFVHYDKVTATQEDIITSALYSDIPNIDKRFKDFKDNVIKSNDILPYQSTHIASKLCFFKFLPLDKEALDKLCEAEEDSPTARYKERKSD